MKFINLYNILIIFLLHLESTSFAQSASQMFSPYFFGGSCASQGVWTQSALGVTQNLRKMTLQLKDDPHCQALGQNIQSALLHLESNLESISTSPQKVSRLAQLPEELSALREFLISSPDMKTSVLKLMMDRSIEQATLSAQVGQLQNITDNNDSNLEKASDVGVRISRSTTTGMELLNQVVDAIPPMEQCLVGDGGQILGSYLSSIVKITAAFSSSNQDSTGSQLARTLSKLTSISRESHFAKILRQLNNQEFLSSMSCLMELTSESYCQSRDAMSLFKTVMKDIGSPKQKSPIAKTNTNTTMSTTVTTMTAYNTTNKTTTTTNNNNNSDSEGDGNNSIAANPFAGSYVLNTHVPNITQWLQKIQVGVDPKLPTDAIFQNKILEEVTEFYKNVKTLLGDYNSNVITIQSLPTIESKQNAVLKLLISVSEKMSGSNNGFQQSEGINFFTISKINIKIPFFLIGMDIVPDQVLGKTMPHLRFDQWLESNLSSIPQFQDPIKLTETIRTNMNSMIRDANLAAIEYFNKWFIVDKAALVNDSTTHINYTIKESLIAIQDYLRSAKKRIEFYKGDASSIPIIIDTQMRIKNILKVYKDIEELGNKYKTIEANNDLNLSVDELLSNAKLYEKLVNTVYEEFNVMLSRSSFLANRMVNFVYNDYILLLKSKVDFSPYQQDLFEAQGMAAFDHMMKSFNGNPSQIQSDLNMALRINSGNIQALEYLIKDNVIQVISELDALNKGEPLSDSSIFKNSLNRLYTDLFNEKYFNTEKRNLYSFYKDRSNIIDFLNLAPASLLYWYQHSDRYPLSNLNMATSIHQSEFEDASALYSQFCIQALAFNDQNGIYNICKDAYLKSPFSNANGFNVSYLEKMQSRQKTNGVTPLVQQSLNYSNRVCAFRDYNRKNMVLFMGISKQDH